MFCKDLALYQFEHPKFLQIDSTVYRLCATFTKDLCLVSVSLSTSMVRVEPDDNVTLAEGLPGLKISIEPSNTTEQPSKVMSAATVREAPLNTNAFLQSPKR